MTFGTGLAVILSFIQIVHFQPVTIIAIRVIGGCKQMPSYQKCHFKCVSLTSCFYCNLYFVKQVSKPSLDTLV